MTKTARRRAKWPLWKKIILTISIILGLAVMVPALVVVGIVIGDRIVLLRYSADSARWIKPYFLENREWFEEQVNAISGADFGWLYFDMRRFHSVTEWGSDVVVFITGPAAPGPHRWLHAGVAYSRSGHSLAGSDIHRIQAITDDGWYFWVGCPSRVRLPE